MKLLIVCLFAGAMADLPRFRPARFRSQRQELTTTEMPDTTTEFPGYPASGWRPAGAAFELPKEIPSTTDASTPDGPYPPSGWKPSGQQFTLPQETPSTTDAYGPPTDTYGPPTNTYGPPAPYPPSGWKPAGQPFALPQEPQTSYGAPDNSYGAPIASTENPQAEKLEGPVEIQKSVGTYYVLLPNGQLQRVEFLTENDIQNMKYTARLQLRDRAPLYVFGP